MAGRLQKGLAFLLLVTVSAICVAALSWSARALALFIDLLLLLWLFFQTQNYRKKSFVRWYWDIEARMARLQNRQGEWVPVNGFKHVWMGRYCLSVQLQLPGRACAWLVVFRRDVSENAWRRLHVAMEWAPPPEMER